MDKIVDHLFIFRGQGGEFPGNYLTLELMKTVDVAQKRGEQSREKRLETK
jgi:hypothetical protein